MHAHDPAIARLVDRVAGLDGAPERGKHEWFYADLAQLAAEVVADAAPIAAVDAYDHGRRDGHTSGYERGWHAALRPSNLPFTLTAEVGV